MFAGSICKYRVPKHALHEKTFQIRQKRYIVQQPGTQCCRFSVANLVVSRCYVFIGLQQIYVFVVPELRPGMFY